jgi:3-methyladenine DNA glycosylase AlkD
MLCRADAGGYLAVIRALREVLSVESIIAEMKSKADRKAVEGMSKFGISTQDTLGLSIPTLRSIAKKVGKDHRVALALWDSGIHEAKILASFVDDPAMVTEAQMEKWVLGFDSWDVCDQCVSNLFDRTPAAFKKAAEWSGKEREFVKRAGFVMMAALAVHDKAAPDSSFLAFFRAIEQGSRDDRNFVKKGVNWALRQIGKRNVKLNSAALDLAGRISRTDNPTARWVASDAIRELKSEAVQRKLRRSS